MTPLLEVTGVSHSFRVGFWMRPVEVLHQVSLSISQGAVFGFLGANGAGKTTLMSLIAGLRKPTQGSIRVAGFESFTPAARSQIGYLPERPYFHEHLTGEDFLKYFGALSGMKRSHVLSRIPRVLSTVGIAHARKLELKRYSKGMLQRIGIAQAILHEPRFLILDEPMSGLDPVGRREIRKLITELAAQGHTLFFSTHVVSDVEAICEQIALIQNGHLVQCGPIQEILNKESIQSLEELFHD